MYGRKVDRNKRIRRKEILKDKEKEIWKGTNKNDRHKKRSGCEKLFFRK
jgi:hypothetical protein